MKKFSFLIIIFVLFFFVTPISAQEDNIGTSRINPASPLYFLKSVKEMVELKFAKTTSAKAYRQLEFATRRIREVKSLSVTSRQDLIQPTLEMYFQHIKELNGVLTLTDEREVARASKEIPMHMDILQTEYLQVTNEDAKRSISLTVNRLSEWEQEIITRLDLLKEASVAGKFRESKLSGCNFLSKEASSSALGEVEKYVYKERVIKCLQINP